MRNVLLAAVSAVALLGSAPEVNAVAAAKEVLLGHHRVSLISYDHAGAHYWYAPHGKYWVVASPARIPDIALWYTSLIDGTPYYFYGVDADPVSSHGLLHMHFPHWHTYRGFVAPHLMDSVLDDAVQSPFEPAETKVK